MVADGTAPEADIKLVVMLQEAFRHCKTVGAWGSGTAVLEACGIAPDGPGVVLGATSSRATPTSSSRPSDYTGPGTARPL